MTSKSLRMNVIQQTPKFTCVVLNGCSCEKENPFTGKLFQGSKYFCVFILQTVGFINYDELKRNIDDYRLKIKHKHFIASDKDLELVEVGWLA